MIEEDRRRRPQDRDSPRGTNPPRILVAEDDSAMRSLLARTLRRAGYIVMESTDGLNLLTHVGSFLLREPGEDIALIISDIRMPGATGLEVLEGLHETAGIPPIILITAFGDRETHEKARRLGCLAVFNKPFDVDDLVATVRNAVPLPPSRHAGGGRHSCRLPHHGSSRRL